MKKIIKILLLLIVTLSMVKHSTAQGSQKLYAWGSQEYGQLGNGEFKNPLTPTQVDKWISVESGNGHTLAINSSGELYAWGKNSLGILGLGNTANQNSPQRVGSASNWTSVAAGFQHNLAINSRGELYAWGVNGSGALGLGNTTNQSSPQRVGSASNWTSVAAGSNFTLAINSDGELYAWGYNFQGQLGLGNSGNGTNQNTPQRVGIASNWTSVAAGSNFTLAINSSGELYAWGANGSGQLGLGNTTEQTTPQRVGSASNWNSFEAGGTHTLAINSNGELYAWGSNSFGQLGLNNTTAQTTPQRVGGASNWTAVVAGYYHTLAINSNRELYAWGRNAHGQLGLGNTTNQNTPQRVGSNNNWSSVAGDNGITSAHALAINSNGELYSWGHNSTGQLGLGNTTNQSSPQQVSLKCSWNKVSSAFFGYSSFAINSNGELFACGNNNMGQLGLGNTNNYDDLQRVGNNSDWVQVVSANAHTLALNNKGEIYAWGYGGFGQLGLGNTSNQTSPQRVGSSSNWVSLTTGHSMSFAINSNGELYAWGNNSSGQLGLGNTTNFSSPQQIGSATNWIFVTAGVNHVIAINSSGELYAWGNNSSGQLGLGNTTNQSSPQLVGSVSNWASVSVGAHHTVAINNLGELYAWGLNDYGQLGLGNTTNYTTPQQIGSSNNWTSVTCDTRSNVALKTNGEMYSWGLNNYGQLGLGDNVDRNSPTKIGNFNNWDKVSVGSGYGLALNSEGVLFVYGDNTYGQLALGNTKYKETPQRVGSASNWSSVAVGTLHTLAINFNGELYAWGYNANGQLGLGNTTNQNTPQRVGSASNWTSVAADGYYSIAINSDGELYAWGSNAHGQLGLGNNIEQSSPQRVGSASNWTSMAAGSHHTLAINSNGELYTWGRNSFGQLGLGNTTSQNSPQRVGSASNWTSVASGALHTIALNTNGELYAWGYNNYGQLGLGNTTNQSSPQRVGSANNWTSVAAGIFQTLAINANGELYAWGYNHYGGLGIGNTTNQRSPQRVGSASKWTTVLTGDGHTLALNTNGELYAWGLNNFGQLGLGNTTNQSSPQRLGIASNWTSVAAGGSHTLALKRIQFIWSGTDTLHYKLNWSEAQVPTSTDSAIIISGTMTVNQSTTLDAMKINNGATVKLTAPLTLRNLHLNDGTIDLNGHKLTITGRIYQSTDSANYYIQAGTSASPKPNSELVFAPTANTSSTLYFNPNANTLKVFELGTATKTAQVTLGNSLKIKGGKTPSNIGSLKVNNGSKLIIPSGASLTLACDTFNSYLNLSHPAQRAIHCSGTGTFNIERQHYGARGWRMYAHPFNADLDLQEIADDIELIGSGGTGEGFYSDAHTNNSSFWYDYSKADTTATTDLAWTGFSSAKGTLMSGNPNKWKKHSPIIAFNPGAVRGTGAFSNPSAATYQEGKITLSYVLDSNAVHLNDGKTQTISTAGLTSAPKSRYFFLTNPFTAPVRLARIQGLNLTNCANKFYYWKQNHASISSNFMPAAWASEALFNGNATRDSNISIPAFGTILIEMKNPSSATTFTIPESAKQLSNFNYLVGGDLSSSSSGVKQTLFMEIPQTYQGPGAIEVQLLMNDSVPVDRMLVYDRLGESSSFTNNDAKKFMEPSFANIYSLTKGGEILALDAQDITSRLNSGVPSVEIPLVIERDFNKSQKNFRLRIWEKHSELQTYFKDAKTGQEYSAESFDDLPIAFEADERVLNRYSLVFKRSSSSTEDFPQEKEALASQAKMDIIIYPNPGAVYIHIRVTHNTQFLPYALYASDGRVVKTGNIKNYETLDIKSLSKGIYYLNCNGISAKVIKP